MRFTDSEAPLISWQKGFFRRRVTQWLRVESLNPASITPNDTIPTNTPNMQKNSAEIIASAALSPGFSKKKIFFGFTMQKPEKFGKVVNQIVCGEKDWEQSFFAWVAKVAAENPSSGSGNLGQSLLNFVTCSFLFYPFISCKVNFIVDCQSSGLTSQKLALSSRYF